jgi:hypothetical protein
MVWPEGVPFSEEHREMISRALTGKPKSFEHRERMHQASTPENRAKEWAAWRRRWDEIRAEQALAAAEQGGS